MLVLVLVVFGGFGCFLVVLLVFDGFGPMKVIMAQVASKGGCKSDPRLFQRLTYGMCSRVPGSKPRGHMGSRVYSSLNKSQQIFLEIKIDFFRTEITSML